MATIWWYCFALQVLVSTRPLKPRLEHWLHQRSDAARAAEAQRKRSTLPMTEADWREQFRERADIAGATTTTAAATAASESELEAELAAIYRKVLGLTDLSLDDNFFDLGGDSLLAVQIMMCIQQQLKSKTPTRIQLRMIFECPTVHTLAERLQSQSSSSAK